ncbi:MAG: HDIG domain-containing protein, partial [Gemmatimonadota bacterium]|nr:HDIG domain-containing protein [Gemmatimonadota bacterium]
MGSRRPGSAREMVIRSLSGDPGSSWEQRFLHHGSRILLLAVVATQVTVFFPPQDSLTVGRYELGMVAGEDVIARVPFSVPKSEDELARDRGQAMDAVPPTFDFVPEAADTVVQRLTRFFAEVDQAGEDGDRDRLRRIFQANSILVAPSQVDLLLQSAHRRVLRRAALQAAGQILREGVVDGSQAQQITTVSIVVRHEGNERTVATSSVLTAGDYYSRAAELLPTSTPPDVADLLRLILIRRIEYSLRLNVVATELDRDAAARSVPTTRADVLQGQAIVRAADPVTADELARLAAYEAQLRTQGLLEAEGIRPGPLFGAWLLHFALLGMFGLVLFFFRPEVYGNFRWLGLIALLTAVYFTAAAAVARNGLAAEWLPVAFVALPVAVLWDARMSVLLVFVLAAVTGALPAFADYGTPLVVMAGGIGAALSIRAVRRRSETWVSIAIITVAAGVVLLADGLVTSREPAEIARGVLYSAGNATISSLLAIGFLWVFELFTGITTDQTLLEWADPARPLLRRLSLEAPGTYAHTISVANLSEAAANAIGANGLLCRVGVYYHDVGKMLKPHYFVENQTDGRNPHDKLKPETSAAIVKEHVTEGARLAREENVPAVLLDFILEHHGTQRIGFFYEKALEEANGEIDTELFAYPGPRPRSKETAIVLLADSCEGATRALKDPTRERIRDLIDNIVDAKIADTQLDDAPLTLAEVS